ncbi:hypothetical protein Tco_0084143 [Tanacetum coccineum]
MKIPDWMITDEIKLTEHYRMYAEVFGLDVPMPQSQSTESTQGTHRTLSAPRRSPRITPPAPVPTVDETDDMILQDTIQVSLAEQKIREEQEAKENVELVKEHLAVEEIEKMVEEEVKINDSEKADNVEEEITNVVIHVNVDDKEEEITDEVYELKRKEKGKIVEEYRSTPFPTLIRSHRIHDTLARFREKKSFNTLADHLQDVMVESLPIMNREEMAKMIDAAIQQELGNLKAEIYSQIQNAIATNIPSQVDASVRSYMSGHILHVHPTQPTTSSAQEQQYQLYLSMKDDLRLQQEDIAIWLALKMKFERLQVPATTCRTPAIRPRDQDDPHDDAHPEGENSNHEQVDDYDFWTDSYASDDDEIPTKLVSQDIMDEVSLTIDEVMLKKVADEMLRQRCTSGDEHQYHIDQMKNFLESDIVWESRKEIIVSPHPRKATPLVLSCQRDPESPALSLINQDLLYLKKGSSGSEKIVLSLHKFPAVIFNEDDIEERTSRWVNKCVKKFNPYARYGVEHWKNPHAKIFYIRKQKEPGKAKEVVYSNSKIIQVIKTYWELGHEHKFITEIVARRANECIVSITEPDFKNLNKNDIEDMYLLIMNGKKAKELDVEEKSALIKVLKSHKRALAWKLSDIQGINPEFCTHKILMEEDYAPALTKEYVEYLQLFEEDIDERLKHRNQMETLWEM